MKTCTKTLQGRNCVSQSMARMAMIFLFLFAATATAEDSARQVFRPVIKETTIVPDTFLRQWDPITVFFTDSPGPDEGGPEDQPDKFIAIKPSHPGAYAWLDSGALQFRPSSPWKPLTIYTIIAGGKSVSLDALLNPPVSSIPAADSEGLDEVETISLTFQDPLAIELLARALTIEASPLPGLEEEYVQTRTSDDFFIKASERQSNQDAAVYVITLKEAIPMGMRITVNLQLSTKYAGIDHGRISFSTAEPFRIVSAGIQNIRYPIPVKGIHFHREQAISSAKSKSAFYLEFSSTPADLTLLDVRNMIRFTPPVDNFNFSLTGKLLEVTGSFKPETVYRALITPIEIKDEKGKFLEAKAESELFFYFPDIPGFLKWSTSFGIVERFGPHSIPVEGRSDRQMDIRIFAVDPMDSSLWPFSSEPVIIDESEPPPGPGEEMKTDEFQYASFPNRLKDRISYLGSPLVSEIIETPFTDDKTSATFGLNIEPQLSRIAGQNQPGTYLVGLRRIEETRRSWMLIQVTDLCLTTAEEADRVHFFVTSLSTGNPVSGAMVAVEVMQSYDDWRVVFEGSTDGQGQLEWAIEQQQYASIRRIRVEKDDDVLILNPYETPEYYMDNQWYKDDLTWLQWTQNDLSYRQTPPEKLSHMFTDRPVYRPDDEVHIKGYVRQRVEGKLTILSNPGFVVIEAPWNQTFREPVVLTEYGSFYVKFQREDLPTGLYQAYFQDNLGFRSAAVKFRMEAYRLPQFEVVLHSPDRASLDKQFNIDLTATYYSGGRVSERPIEWRITQFPLVWSNPDEKGFVFSKAMKFLDNVASDSTPRTIIENTTDDSGFCQLKIDPSAEMDANPRTYVIEATVTGMDDQTVTAVKKVEVVPPFMIGLKIGRYYENASDLNAEAGVWGVDKKLLSGQPLTVRLINRQWHSYLRTGDFSDGVARYETDVVEEQIYETSLTSSSDILSIPLDIPHSGVFILEVESRDELGRAQVASSDFYVGGDEAVTWSKPASNIIKITPDKDSYNPGETATFVIKSPFQESHCLAIIEAPDGNEYRWVTIQGGVGTFQILIKNLFAPKLPVHFVLMRGRIPTASPVPGGKLDLGKPVTMAATSWITINPIDNMLEVKLEYPEKAEPGDEIEISALVASPQGKPLAGEMTLWLVDQAVLALGKEQRLDPLPDMIKAMPSQLLIHDTRFMPFGELAYAEKPGGGAGDEGEGSIFDRSTLRKDFKAVPYFNPSIIIDDSGKARVKVRLPDNLTNFKIRAKVVSGSERLGFGIGHIAVRLPIVIQPNLPRFVRPGDVFSATAIGRIVEGDGGEGSFELRVEGATITGEAKSKVQWKQGIPERFDIAIQIPQPAYGSKGELNHSQVKFDIGVERDSDGATDAMRIEIPVCDEAPRITSVTDYDLNPLGKVQIPEIKGDIRPGSLIRSISISSERMLLKASSGLNFLIQYPFGCTEQRISKARALIAFRGFKALLKRGGDSKAIDRQIQETADYVKSIIQPNGLCAFWPGSTGYVSLTAWVFQFLTEARTAGYSIDEKTYDGLARILGQSLRSDYKNFVQGEEYTERVWALRALAAAGRLESPFAAELARNSQWLNAESLANVILASVNDGQMESEVITQLTDLLWESIIFQLSEGNERFSAFNQGRISKNGILLSTEKRTIATVVRAMHRQDSENPKFQLLKDALLCESGTSEVMDTNAVCEMLLTFTDLLKSQFKNLSPQSVKIKSSGDSQSVQLDSESPVAVYQTTDSTALEIESGKIESGKGKKQLQPAQLMLRVEDEYVSAEDMSKAVQKAEGFAVTREASMYRSHSESPEHVTLDAGGMVLNYKIGDIIEERLTVVNPEDRNYIAISVPLGAGLELLNPNLETAPPEAKPVGKTTLIPSYKMFMDDKVSYYYDALPKGTYDFYFRTRATIAGNYAQPPARAEMMYNRNVYGNSSGARVEIQDAESP